MKLAIFVSALLTVGFAEIQLSPGEIEEARLALQNPDLYDGDMAGIEFDADRAAITGEVYRWTGAKVPYVIDNSLANAKNVIVQGFRDYHANTCVRFVPRTNEKNYIKIYYGSGCFSHVGMTGGEQPLSLGKGCLRVGTVVHEFAHALGFYHEQSRSDRDQYVFIYLQNVDREMRHNFFKLSPKQNILHNEFDLNSIMMFGNKAFSINGQQTMVARNGQHLLDPYQKYGMTKSDIYRVNQLYNCNN